jgi:cytochrome d ubiquinol oxidase subunit I
MFSMAMWMALLAAPVQIVVGDMHGLNTLHHQPAKIAALEGDWITGRGVPLILVGWPNMETETTDYAISVPYLGSLILTHELDGEIRGLKEWPPEDRPFAPLLFWAFRLMVGIGFLMAGLGIAGLVLRWRNALYSTPWLLRAMVAMAPAGFIAVLAGWVVTEVGRQPFTVYGMLRTADSVSPIGTPGVATSLAGFAVVYLIVFGAGFVFLMRMMSHPPEPGEPGPEAELPSHAAGIMPGPAGHMATGD